MELNFPHTPKPIQKRPLWKSAAVALVSLIVIVIAFFFWTHPGASCIEKGGVWFYDADLSVSWLDPMGYCLYTYSDGGKPCKNSFECQGRCQNGFCESGRGLQGDILFGNWEWYP